MKKILLFLAFSLLAADVVGQSRVRNLIFLIGDGMGLAHLSMLEIEQNLAPTAFERAQGVALVSTHSANNRVTDSAAASTALACGAKTDNAALGKDPAGRRLSSLMERAGDKGLARGLVATCYLQHATPAAFYAHVAHRDSVELISEQLLASGVDVLLGGGRKWLERPCGQGGSYMEAFRRSGYTVAGAMEEVDTVRAGRVIGVFADKHLPPAEARGDYFPRAVSKSLELLSKASDKGFMLMAEGSQIDLAGHANDAAWLLAELRDFERAVAVAMDFADRTPGTLVVIAADHETGGLTIPGNEEDFTLAESGLNYCFSTKTHTAVRVPVYFYGEGATALSGVMDNTSLSLRIAGLMGL